jgi:hypothetical protein
MHTVFVGKRPLTGPLAVLGLQHWGMKVGDYWYEIETKTKGLTVENQIRVTERPEINFPEVHRIGTTMTTPEQMKHLMTEWLKVNKHYRITDQNCQYWVFSTLRKLGFDEKASSMFLPQLSKIFGRDKI